MKGGVMQSHAVEGISSHRRYPACVAEGRSVADHLVSRFSISLKAIASRSSSQESIGIFIPKMMMVFGQVIRYGVRVPTA
jgi:hypothetical protein